MNDDLLDEHGQLRDPRFCRSYDGNLAPHEWSVLTSTPSCHRCSITPDGVREAFRDWRYEVVMLRLVDALGELADSLRSQR